MNCIGNSSIDMDAILQAIALMDRGNIKITGLVVDSATFLALEKQYNLRTGLNTFYVYTSYGKVVVCRE